MIDNYSLLIHWFFRIVYLFSEYENYRNKPQWYNLHQPILLPSAVGSTSETALKAAGIRTQPALVLLSRSVTAGKHHLFADAGLTMGRSFRVGWGPGWTLTYSARTTSVSAHSKDHLLGREIVRGSPLVASSVKSKQSSSFTISCARVNVSPTMKWNSEVSQVSTFIVITNPMIFIKTSLLKERRVGLGWVLLVATSNSRKHI